jgi:hypothetical protein
MCSSGKGLDLALDESADQLEARHLFFGCGPQLPDLLHQRLYNRHFFLTQLVRPRRPRLKCVGRSKFLKHEALTGGRLVLGIEPPCSPASVALRHPRLEVFDLGAHRAAETADLIV